MIYESGLVFKYFLDRGFEPNMAQIHATNLLIDRFNEIYLTEDVSSRILSINLGSQKGNTTLWLAFADAYPNVHLAFATRDVARVYNSNTIKDLLKQKPEPGAIVIYDAGGAMYACSGMFNVSPEDIKTFVQKNNVRAFIIS